MKKNYIIIAALASLLTLTACGEQTSSESSPTSSMGDVSSPNTDAGESPDTGDTGDTSPTPDVPVETYYDVIVNNVEGLSITPSATSAKEGDTVTFRVEIADPYNKALSEVKVLFNGEALQFEEKDGVYSFVMPKGDVTITATLVDVIHTFALTLTKDDYVTPTFSVDGVTLENTNKIEAGKVVTMNLAFEEGYELDGAPQLSDPEVTLTTIEEGVSYSFSMPEEDLAITLSSVQKAPVVATKTITKIDYSTTFIKGVYVDSNYTEPLTSKSFNSGETVNLYVTRNTSGITKSVYNYGFAINGGEQIMLEWDGSSSSNLIGSFTMPEEDVDIVVFPVNKPTTSSSSFTLEFEESSLYTVYGITSGAKYNTSYKLPFVVRPKGAGVKIEKPTFTYQNSSGTETTKNVSGGSSGSSCYYITSSTSYKQTTLTISITATEHTLHKLSFNDVDKVTLTDFPTDGFIAGDSVTFVAKGKYPYYVKGVKSVVDSDGNDITTDVSPYFSPSDNTIYLYTLPEKDITITFDIDKGVPVTIEKNDDIASVSVKNILNGKEFPVDADKPLAYKGATLCVNPTLSSGVTTAKKDILAYCNDIKMDDYTFSGFGINIPADTTATNFVIRFVVPKEHSINYTASGDGYEITSLSATSAFAGTDISFHLQAKTGYKIISAKLDDGTVLTKGTDDKYHFSMPDKDVSIVIETEAITTYTVSITKDAGVASLVFNDANNNSVTPNEDGNLVVNDGTKLNFTVSTNNGFDLVSVQYAGATLEENASGKYEFTVTGDATLKVETKERAKGKINVTATDLNSSDYSVIVYDNENRSTDAYCHAGSQARVRIMLTNSANYEAVTKDQFEVVNDSTRGAIEFTFTAVGEGLKFTMPDDCESVTITFTPVLKSE